MQDSVTRCAHCSAVLSPGAHFCEACGRRVVAPSSAAPRSEPRDRCGRESPKPPFELAAALPKALKVNQRSLVYVIFKASHDNYEKVEFVLRNGAEELCRRPCCAGRPGTDEQRVTLEVLPKFAGTVQIELVVICSFGTLQEESETHAAALQIMVEAADAGAAFAPVINISQTQNSDRAGDSKGGDINVNLGGIEWQRRDDPSRYMTDAQAYVPLATELRESPSRLTLEGADGVVQLVSDRAVSFGRNRDNTIALRICGADGRVDRAANENNISRFHFGIACDGRVCCLTDGGIAPDSTSCGVRTPSAYGTRLDGRQIPPAGEAVLRPGRDLALGIGREAVELRLRLRVFKDDWRDPAGFILDREDGARQRICAVWRELQIAEGTSVSWNGCRWGLSGACGTVPIAVGSSVLFGGRTFTVLPFHHTHVN